MSGGAPSTRLGPGGGGSSRLGDSKGGGGSSRLTVIGALIAARARIREEDSALGWVARDRLWALQKAKGGTHEWFAGAVRVVWGGHCGL